MTHVDTLIRHGFDVSTKLEFASQLIHDLEGVLAATEEGGDEEADEEAVDDLATETMQARIRALTHVRDVHRDLERAVLTLDTVDAAVTVLPNTAYIDEILDALAEAGVSISRLASQVRRCRDKLGRLERVVNDVRRRPADGALVDRVVSARSATVEATNYIDYLAAEHKLLVGLADSDDLRQERQAALGRAEAAHESVETFDDLLGLSQHVFELLQIAADRAERAQDLLRSRSDRAAVHGFGQHDAQWSNAAYRMDGVRGGLNAAIDEVSAAIADLEEMPTVNQVSDVVSALGSDAISLSRLTASLELTVTELNEAWDAVPVKPGSATHTATIIDGAFDDAQTAVQSATYELQVYTSAHPEVVAAIDAHANA